MDIMYFQLATLRRMESTLGISDGCGLDYLPILAKAVTKHCPPEALFTRMYGLTYSTTMFRSSTSFASVICLHVK